MYIKGIDVKTFNRIVEELRKRGLWAERHSYSMRMMLSEKFVASAHFYPGHELVVIRIYGEPEAGRAAASIIEEVLRTHLKGYKLEFKFIEPPSLKPQG